MSKIKFNFDKNDILGYMSDKFNLKSDKFKFSKNSNKEDDKDNNKKDKEDNEKIENLTSLNTKSKAIEKNLIKKTSLIVIGLPVLIFFIAVFWNMYKILNKESVRQISKKAEEKENFNLKVNDTFKWRILKDQEIKTLGTKIVKLKTSLKKDMNNTVALVSKKIDENNKFIKDQIGDLKQIVTESDNNVNKNLLLIKQRQDLLEKKINNQSKIFNKKIKAIKSSKEDFSNISLPKLPPLKFSKSVSTIKGKNKQNIKYAKYAKTVAKKPTKTVVYNIESSKVDMNTINYSTLPKENNSSNQSKLPTFTLMPGFAKGVLLNGGEVPAMLSGAKEPTPIFIRLTGNELIANDANVNIDGCLIEATASGDLSKQSVEIRLSRISCNLSDMDGNKYKIDQKIEGWVFGENGAYGVPGRLVTREGQIIKAGLPLTLVESMINGLNAAISKSTSGGTSLLGTTSSSSNGVGVGALQGVSTGTNAVLKKFSDYYLKMLDVLNPTISIRAGREVVIGFKGGETLKVTKYKPINTAYFLDNSFGDMK